MTKGDYCGWEVLSSGGKVYLMLGLKSVELTKNNVASFNVVVNDADEYVVAVNFLSGEKSILSLTYKMYRDLTVALI